MSKTYQNRMLNEQKFVVLHIMFNKLKMLQALQYSK